jgi:hypothetical protein
VHGYKLPQHLACCGPHRVTGRRRTGHVRPPLGKALAKGKGGCTGWAGTAPGGQMKQCSMKTRAICREQISVSLLPSGCRQLPQQPAHTMACSLLLSSSNLLPVASPSSTKAAGMVLRNHTPQRPQQRVLWATA